MTKSKIKNLQIFGVVTLALFLSLMIFSNPIAQWPEYHQFQDAQMVLGIPNFLNVVSNGGFLILGVYGILLAATRRKKFSFLKSGDWIFHLVLWIGCILTGLGSAYYHWAPSNDRLIWDRLPMTLCFTSIIGITLIERTDLIFFRRFIWALVAMGAASVYYWSWSESQGHGDLRPYGFFQFYPAIALPYILRTLSARFTEDRRWYGVMGYYLAAKIFEAQDVAIFKVTGGLIGGHPIKHLFATLALTPLLMMLIRRRPTGNSSSS